MDFPPRIPRRRRLVLGAAGVAGVLVVWWLITYPFFEVATERRVANPTGRMETQTDPVTGEPVRVPVVEYTIERATEPRALVNPPALESPGATWRRAVSLQTDAGAGPTLGAHIWKSTFRVLVGFLISALVAVPLGIAMGLFPRLHAFIRPGISFLRPLPSISWVPLTIIWLGAGEAQKLAIIFVGSFSAALIYTIEATQKVDPDLIRAARNLGVAERRLLSKVLFPAALPNILSGLKVVMAIAWTCVISAEIVGSRDGLGQLIWSSKEINDTAAVLVGMVCISAIVLVLDWLFERVEQRLVPWAFLGAERGEAAP